MPVARARPARHGVGARHEGVGAVVEVEQRALGALEHHPLPRRMASSTAMDASPSSGPICGRGAPPRPAPLHRRRLDARRARPLASTPPPAPDDPRGRPRLGSTRSPSRHADARGLVAVRRADAAAGGADGARARVGRPVDGRLKGKVTCARPLTRAGRTASPMASQVGDLLQQHLRGRSPCPRRARSAPGCITPLGSRCVTSFCPPTFSVCPGVGAARVAHHHVGALAR
jgi:hypothetical protein